MLSLVNRKKVNVVKPISVRVFTEPLGREMLAFSLSRRCSALPRSQFTIIFSHEVYLFRSAQSNQVCFPIYTRSMLRLHGLSYFLPSARRLIQVCMRCLCLYSCVTLLLEWRRYSVESVKIWFLLKRGKGANSFSSRKISVFQPNV